MGHFQLSWLIRLDNDSRARRHTVIVRRIALNGSMTYATFQGQALMVQVRPDFARTDPDVSTVGRFLCRVPSRSADPERADGFAHHFPS